MRTLHKKIFTISAILALPTLIYFIRNFLYRNTGLHSTELQYELIYQVLRVVLTPLVVFITARFWMDLDQVPRLVLTQIVNFIVWSLAFVTLATGLCYFATSQTDLRLWNMVMTIRQESMTANVLTFLITVSAFYAWIYFERYREAARHMQAMSSVQPQALPDRISVKTGTKVLLVPLSEILYFQSDGPYTRVVTAGHTYLLSRTIQRLQRELPPVFIRIHRSRIVNSQFIELVKSLPNGDHLLTIKGGAEIRASRTYRDQLSGLKR